MWRLRDLPAPVAASLIILKLAASPSACEATASVGRCFRAPAAVAPADVDSSVSSLFCSWAIAPKEACRWDACRSRSHSRSRCLLEPQDRQMSSSCSLFHTRRADSSRNIERWSCWTNDAATWPCLSCRIDSPRSWMGCSSPCRILAQVWHQAFWQSWNCWRTPEILGSSGSFRLVVLLYVSGWRRDRV